MRKALEDVANKYLNLNQKPNKQWISDNTWGLIKEKQQIKVRGRKLDRDRENYSRIIKEINKALRKDRNIYVATICEEVEKHAVRNEPRDLFQKIKAITRSFQPRLMQIKNEEGRTLTAKSKVIQRWRQY